MLAAVIIALTLISARHLATGSKMSSDVEKAPERSTDCLKTPTGPSLCLYGHIEENLEHW